MAAWGRVTLFARTMVTCWRAFPPSSQSICSRCDAFALCRIALRRNCGNLFSD